MKNGALLTNLALHPANRSKRLRSASSLSRDLAPTFAHSFAPWLGRLHRGHLAAIRQDTLRFFGTFSRASVPPWPSPRQRSDY